MNSLNKIIESAWLKYGKKLNCVLPEANYSPISFGYIKVFKRIKNSKKNVVNIDYEISAVVKPKLFK